MGHILPRHAGIIQLRTVDFIKWVPIQIPGQLLVAHIAGGAIHLERPGMIVGPIEADEATAALLNITIAS